MKQIRFIIAILAILFLSKPAFADTCIKTDSWGNRTYYECQPVGSRNNDDYDDIERQNRIIQLQNEAIDAEWDARFAEEEARRKELQGESDKHWAEQQEFNRNIGNKSW